TLAAAVRHDANVACEQLRQRIEIPRLGCRQEYRHELRMPRIDLARTHRRRGRAAWPRCTHVRACAGGKLPARGFAALECCGYFAEREIEHIVQQEGCPLERREPVERQEQRNRQILGQLCTGVGRERCCVENRLW